jgi:deferrochelatase/peroxidase EfeB
VTPPAVDYRDVQGLVRFGYKHLRAARYALVRVRHRAAACEWLREAPVTSAEFVEPPPPAALHVALTASGLEALGVPASIRAAFSPEFLGGMTESNRARRLGDVGTNAPAHWLWGGDSGAPHVLVVFFADAGQLDPFVQRCTGPLWADAFQAPHLLDTADLDGVEPFGFVDGISQPTLDWGQSTDPATRLVDYSNVAALGEFVLGYPNEYGKYTDRPLVDPDASSAALPDARDDPGKKDVGRNGTYLVMSQLGQNVRGFWQFVHRTTGGDAVAAERLASAFVGRTVAGDPLVPVTTGAIAGTGTKPEQIRQNQFTFDTDPRGVRCPVGAHIRRSNPRNTDYPGRPAGLSKLLAALGWSTKGFRDDLLSAVRFHRILRRGREYGPPLLPVDALGPAPAHEHERGLHFIGLNANIGRQFEFLQNAWLMNTTFADLRGETDPLVGTRDPSPGCPATGDFTWPREGAPAERISGLPQFVTVKGGEYFFLPGCRPFAIWPGSRRLP